MNVFEFELFKTRGRGSACNLTSDLDLAIEGHNLKLLAVINWIERSNNL